MSVKRCHARPHRHPGAAFFGLIDRRTPKHSVEDRHVSTAGAQDIRTLRVVLVDARVERRPLMRQVLEGPGVMATVIGEADSQPAALALLDRHDAELVILEIQMPVQAGLETIAALRDRLLRLGIVVCSFHRDVATKARALDQGPTRTSTSL